MPSDDFNRDADYWKRVGAGNNPPQNKPGRVAVNKPAPLPIDDTDPLALIYAALRANADATKQNTAEVQALRQAVGVNDSLSGHRQAAMEDQIRSILRAVNEQTAGAERIANAEEAKVTWGIGGIVIGFILCGLFFVFVAPLLQRVFG